MNTLIRTNKKCPDCKVVQAVNTDHNIELVQVDKPSPKTYVITNIAVIDHVLKKSCLWGDGHAFRPS